jgi:hypothetical protein
MARTVVHAKEKWGSSAYAMYVQTFSDGDTPMLCIGQRAGILLADDVLSGLVEILTNEQKRRNG